jgi:hypothetical protein
LIKSLARLSRDNRMQFETSRIFGGILDPEIDPDIDRTRVIAAACR